MSDPIEKFPAESKLFDMNCADQLAAGETILGTPVMTFLPELSGPDGIVIGPAVVNAVEAEYPDGRAVLPGQALQFRIAGGSVPSGEAYREYLVLATFQTNLGNTLIARGALRVVALDQ